MLKKDRIEVIKDTVRYLYYSEKLLTSAQNWILMSEDKSLDKRKKHEEKKDFEYLQNILREEVFKIHPLKLHLSNSKDMKNIIVQLNLRSQNLIPQCLNL